MSGKVLVVKDLSVAYGKVEAVSKISLEVGEGKIVTVIGPNGAGKTTTLSAIMGLLPSSGQVAFDGSIEQVPEVERMVVRGMNLVPEKRELFGTMSDRGQPAARCLSARPARPSRSSGRRWRRSMRSSRA